MPKVLALYASPRGNDSNSRKLARQLAEKVADGGQITERSLIDSDLPYVTNEMIGSYYTAPDQRSSDQHNVISDSDKYVAEVQDADIIVLGTPMYNFTVPSTLKTWIDLVARVGVTFNYGANGPIGLLEGKKAYFVITTGGTPLNSPVDHISGYLKTFFGFIGITDSEVIDAAQLNVDAEGNMNSAKEQIAAV